MTEEVSLGLLPELDPQRNYGKRTYEEVVQEVGEGRLRLFAGATLPVIVQTDNGQSVTGTGQPLQGEQPAEHRTRESFQIRSETDLPVVYDAILHAIVEKHDPRAMKIWMEYAIGKPPESRQDRSESLTRLMEMLQQGSKVVDATVVRRGD